MYYQCRNNIGCIHFVVNVIATFITKTWLSTLVWDTNSVMCCWHCRHVFLFINLYLWSTLTLTLASTSRLGLELDVSASLNITADSGWSKLLGSDPERVVHARRLRSVMFDGWKVSGSSGVHWPGVTDDSGISTCGLTEFESEMSIPYLPLRNIVFFYVYIIMPARCVSMECTLLSEALTAMIYARNTVHWIVNGFSFLVNFFFFFYFGSCGT